MKTKRIGALTLAASLLVGLAAAPAAAAPNTPPEIHGLSEFEWPDNRALPWREGVTATDAEDGDLTSRVEFSPTRHPSDRPGDDPDATRYFVYSVTDNAGATTTAKRYVTFVPADQWHPGNKAPVLTSGATGSTCVGQAYDPLKHVRFNDDYDGQNLPYKTNPSQLNPDGIATRYRAQAGSYDRVGTVEHSYGFIDSDGAQLSVTIPVTVRDCSAPQPASRGFFLNDGWGPNANRVYTYGRASDEVYVGDWDGNGTDTLALRRGNTFYINNGHDGTADRVIHYGRPGDVILVGDWDGDGVDTFAVRRGKTYHVKNSVSGGNADQVIHYGRAGDQVLVGDWDGDGVDTFAVRRGKTYHVKNRIAGGNADQVIHYGRAGDDVYAGDWDGDGRDSFTVRRGKTYYVNNAIRGGDADRVLNYGRVNDVTLVGDWNGDGRDTLGVRR